MTTAKSKLRVGLVVPHIFMHRDILPGVIFSPGTIALELATGLHELGVDVTLFSPGPVDTVAHNLTADLSYFEAELKLRGDKYLDLLKKHPLTFISLARQAQSELIALAYEMANRDELDVVHIYTNEEDIALSFSGLCKRPVLFTHHDPFNFLIRYKNIFPKYKDRQFISMSYAQRTGMPADTNWVANIYHGLDVSKFTPRYEPPQPYIAYLGRIIKTKGVHLAIEAVKLYNRSHKTKLTLKIAGKHYAGTQKDTYWKDKIEPLIDGQEIEYAGYLDPGTQRQAFLGQARALIVPSLFDEPFGMVVVEAMACGTPVLGLKSGAIPELIDDDKTGILVDAGKDDAMVKQLAASIDKLDLIDRRACRRAVEERFTLERMCKEHLAVYKAVAKG